jgi:precorrin-2 methylase
MSEWNAVIGNVASGLAVTGVAAASGLLVNVAIKVNQIDAKLASHIASERGERERTEQAVILKVKDMLDPRLKRIEDKLPNGEVQKTFEMVTQIHERLFPEGVLR